MAGTEAREGERRREKEKGNGREERGRGRNEGDKLMSVKNFNFCQGFIGHWDPPPHPNVSAATISTQHNKYSMIRHS